MASASFNQALSSASTLHPFRWDVFISFRGIDTRYMFVDYLYDALLRAGIQTFKDDDKIRSGESISKSLVQAIHESEIYIVVLSENYASSTWCLDELVEMLSCQKLRYTPIIPVFYNIEPLAVSKQTGSFREAFEKHGTRYDMDRLDTWRNALEGVTRVSGYLVPENMSQTYTISKVVDEVSQLINCVDNYGRSCHYVNLASLLGAEWGVFVSCADTRCTFVGHLLDSLDRTGVRVFRDDPELHSVEDQVSVRVTQVIENSKIYVVVFSEKYAYSRRCLNELVEMFKKCNSTGRTILPVFYNIVPSIVRYQVGSFNEAFQEHKAIGGYRKDKLDGWRVALTNVGNLSGYQVHKNMSQIDIINKVVDRVSLEINPTALNVPVGLNSQVEGITTFLRNVTERVIKFGIHGAGKGKTTLAKALFKQLWPGSFKRCCFLKNVKKVLGTANGLVSLQRQVIEDMLPKQRRIDIDNVDQGIEVIRAKFCWMKVLMVIDNVNDPGTLEFLVGTFALGSIIIITTENEDLLDSVKVESKYMVNGPGDAASRQICCNF